MLRRENSISHMNQYMNQYITLVKKQDNKSGMLSMQTIARRTHLWWLIIAIMYMCVFVCEYSLSTAHVGNYDFFQLLHNGTYHQVGNMELQPHPLCYPSKDARTVICDSSRCCSAATSIIPEY